MSSLHRIIDANANRAREGLRVIEEAARFHLDHAAWAREAKDLRHDLREAVMHFGPVSNARDAEGDVGTDTTADAETVRRSIGDVVGAAASRVSEAMRVIEEYGKIIDSAAAARVEQLRYRVYDLGQAVARAASTADVRQWRCCLLLTIELCEHPWEDVVARAIEAGVDCIQVREKAMTDQDLARHVRRVIAIARPLGVPVIVNDRVDIALATGADGVHLGQGDLSVPEARRIAGDRTLIVGVSTHDPDEAAAAVEAGADYCGVGAMFQTSLKPDRVPSGVEYLAWFVQTYPTTPHLAIGGITPATVGSLVQAGLAGIAVSGAICSATEPGAVVAALRTSMRPDPAASVRTCS